MTRGETYNANLDAEIAAGRAVPDAIEPDDDEPTARPNLPTHLGPFYDPSWSSDAIILAGAEFFGVQHHVLLIRVRDDADGYQEVDAAADDDTGQSIWNDVTQLYDDKYQTVTLPGLTGEWVIVIHPYGS